MDAWVDEAAGAVSVERRGGVAVVRFGDPARRNPLSRAVLLGLRRAAGRLAAEGARAAVLAGRGEHFSSGADIADVRAAVADPDEYTREVQRAVEAWAAVPIPTVAALEGWVLGGGLELAAACDLRVASRSARLGLPEMRLGLHPAAGGLSRLPRLMGPAWTANLAYSGEPFPAADLAPTGFLLRLTDPGQSLADALRLAAFLAERPLAAGVVRELAREAASPDPDGLRREREGFARCLAEPATLARLDAFLSQRGPGA